MNDCAITNLLFENLRFCQHFFDFGETIEVAYGNAISETISAGFSPRIPFALYQNTPADYYFLTEAVKYANDSVSSQLAKFVATGFGSNRYPHYPCDSGGRFATFAYKEMNDSKYIRNIQFVYSLLNPSAKTTVIPYGKRYYPGGYTTKEDSYFVIPDDIYFNPPKLSQIPGIYNGELLQDLLDNSPWDYEGWFNAAEMWQKGLLPKEQERHLCLNDYGLFNIKTYPIGSWCEVSSGCFTIVNKIYYKASITGITQSIESSVRYMLCHPDDEQASFISCNGLVNDLKLLKSRAGSDTDITKFYEVW